MTPAEFLGVALVLFVVITALADRPVTPAYTMSRSRRRRLMRDRADLNPALREPRVWRLG